MRGAKHNQALHVAGDEYRRRVLEFFEQHLADDRPRRHRRRAAQPSTAASSRDSVRDDRDVRELRYEQLAVETTHEHPDPHGPSIACCTLPAAASGRQARRHARSAAAWRSSRPPPTDPREVQEALLRGILAHQADTDFGRDHRFATIRTVADFRRQLPVAGYDYFEPYIARVRNGEFNALLADPRVHMFALTSGTTATRKYIPVTPQYLADYQRGWNLWGLKVFRDHPEVTLRPIVQMSGDWDEFRTEAGIPCGSRHRPDGDDAEAHHPLALLRAGRASARSRTPPPSTTSPCV